MIQRIAEAVQVIRNKSDFVPRAGIILGTGLGGFTNHMDIDLILPYQNIPYFPISTVESHQGNFIMGRIEEVPVAALQGRFHYYEGYSPDQIIFPVRVLAQLGVETLFISNAAGGLNPIYYPGQIVFVKDHINLLPFSPLRGHHQEELGPRFPDMTFTYDTHLITLAKNIADRLSIPFQTGIYTAVQGPQLETPAEHRFLRTIGADLVGMSTIPEVIAAKQLGMKIMVISVVTNQCLSQFGPKETTIEEVIKVASETEPLLSKLVKELILESDRFLTQ